MAFFSGEQFVFQSGQEIKLQQMRDNAVVRKSLNHYTNLESLLRIFDTKTLKMTSIKYLNDKKEASYIAIDNIEDLVFVSSFCHSGENIPLWHMYTELKYGVNIELNYQDSGKSFSTVIYDESRLIEGNVSLNNELNRYNRVGNTIGININSEWQVELFESDVKYDDNGIETYPVWFDHEERGKLYNLTSLGVVKHSAWSYENETRLVAHFRTVKNKVEMANLDFILIPITFKNLDNITITFSPWMSTEVKEIIRKYVEEKVTECEIEFKNSIFTGIIERKF